MSRFLSKASESLLPYTPGEQPQGRKFIKLNTNECPYPPSPKVAEAILAGYEENSSKIMPLELANLRLYSDPEERILIEAIADHYGVGTNQVIAGNGSDEILGFAFRAFCDQNAPLQFADLTYGFYPALCGLYGIPFKVVPLEEDFTLNIEPYKNCGNNVIIANPNAPTGMNLPLSAIEEVAASNPDRVVMVDEAYGFRRRIVCITASEIRKSGDYPDLFQIPQLSRRACRICHRKPGTHRGYEPDQIQF